MTRQRVRIQDDESGFTFIEMVIAIVIMTMLMGAIAAVFVTSAANTNATKHRSNQANDAQVIASFFVRDAQAAGGVDPNTGLNDPSFGVFTNAPVAACTGAGAAITTTVVRFRWLDPSGPTYEDAVYWLSSNVLMRTFCTTPTAGGSTTTNDTNLAKTITSASVTCTTAASTGACDNGINGQPQLPDSVHMLISATSTPTPGGTAIVGSYSYTLSANLRPSRLALSDIPSPDNSPLAALITLGASCNSPAPITVPNNATLKVYGGILMNANSGCDVIGNAPGTVFDYNSLTPSAGVPNNPFANLQAPSTTGQPTRTGNCNGGIALPGVYASPFSATNCTFQSGVYIFQNGLQLGGTIDATSGVLFYLSGGALTTATGNGNVFTINAMSSGPYAGLAFWQVSSTQIDVGNVGTLKINGTFYAPNAILHFGNVSTTTQITNVIVQAIDQKNVSTANFGPAPKQLAVSALSLPSQWTAGAAITPIQMTGSGGAGQYLWSMTGNSGLSIDSNGLITGSPNQGSPVTATVHLNDTFNDLPEAKTTATMNVVVPATITTASLPNGNRNVAYNQTLQKSSGGTAPFTWSVSSGALPNGLTLNASSGLISGVPTIIKAYSFTIALTDGAGYVTTRSYSITIGTPPTITAVSPASLGQAATSQNIVITGTNFQVGAVVTFSPATGIAINTTTRNNVTQITVNVTIDPAAPTGARDVTETNPDTGTFTQTGGFAVGPNLVSASPNSMTKGTSGTVTITGTGFLNGASLNVAISGSKVTVTNPIYVDATTITATVILSGTASTGARTLTVTNGDGTPAGNTVMFTVTS